MPRTQCLDEAAVHLFSSRVTLTPLPARTKRVQPPNEEKLEDLFRCHAAAVRAYARRRVPLEAVDDVVAETFAVAWRRLDRIPPDSLPWLLGVARNVAATQLRGARRARSLRERLWRSERPRVDHWTPSAGVRAEVAQALAGLSEEDREAITLVAWDELTPAEAARVMGKSSGAFRVRLHRVRTRLQRELALSLADSPGAATITATASAGKEGPR